MHIFITIHQQILEMSCAKHRMAATVKKGNVAHKNPEFTPTITKINRVLMSSSTNTPAIFCNDWACSLDKYSVLEIRRAKIIRKSKKPDIFTDPYQNQ